MTRAMSRARCSLVLLCVALAGAILAVGPATATAASSVAVFSDPADFLGQGNPDAYSAAAQISTGTAALVPGDHVVVNVYEPGLGRWELIFAAPAGARLEPRNYVDAQDATFRDPGHPGLSATADAQRTCNEVYGRFEVRDIVRRDDGSVSRLWIVFQLHCEAKVPATWGEVRIGVPASATTPAVVRWPEQDSWQIATRVPVRYSAGAPLAGVTLAGEHPADFSADDRGCRATSCVVDVAFDPTTPGARSAVLRLTDAAGGVHDVALEGFRHGGTTRTVVEDVLKTDVDPDRPARTFVHEPPASRFSGLYHESGLVVLHVDQSPQWWELRLWPGAAGWQGGHTYADAANGTGGGERPAMDLFGHETVCNASSSGATFTVHSISREPDGGLRTIDVSFEQPCYEGEQRRPASLGRWSYRAGDATPFADWLIPGPRPGLGPPPPAPAPPAPGAPGTIAPERPGSGGTALSTTGAGAPGAAGAPLRTGRPSGSAPRPLSPASARQALKTCARRTTRPLAGTGAADALRGGASADRLLGRGGADRLLGRRGADCLHGGPGDDRLDGGPGRDRLFGGSGDDSLVGGPQADLLDCGPGRHDRAAAGPGDRIRGCERVRRVTR